MLISLLEVLQKRGEFVKGENGDFLQSTQRGGENFTHKQKTAFLWCAFRGLGEEEGEGRTGYLTVTLCMILPPHHQNDGSLCNARQVTQSRFYGMELQLLVGPHGAPQKAQQVQCCVLTVFKTYGGEFDYAFSFQKRTALTSTFHTFTSIFKILNNILSSLWQNVNNVIYK